MRRSTGSGLRRKAPNSSRRGGRRLQRPSGAAMTPDLPHHSAPRTWRRRARPGRCRASVVVQHRDRCGRPAAPRNFYSSRPRTSTELPRVEMAGRYSNPPKPLKSVMERLDRWARVDRAPPASPLPTRIEHRLGHAATRELVEAYRFGSATRELSARYGVSKSAVIEVLRRQGINLRPRGSTRRDRT